MSLTFLRLTETEKQMTEFRLFFGSVSPAQINSESGHEFPANYVHIANSVSSKFVHAHRCANLYVHTHRHMDQHKWRTKPSHKQEEHRQLDIVPSIPDDQD